MKQPQRIELVPGYQISRIITGLWQVADIEKTGNSMDMDSAARSLVEYAETGFDTFDMADHYGSAELIAGHARMQLLKDAQSKGSSLKARFHTKWCPKPGEMTAQKVRDGVLQSAERLAVEQIDMMQFHWWNYEHPDYLEAMEGLQLARDEGIINQIGLTNFDTDHLHLLLQEGHEIISNQVVVSLLDRRALEEMSELCLKHGIKLLAYGSVAGGFLSEKWLGKVEPSLSQINDWSKMKYKRFIEQTGGWEKFQQILATLDRIAQKKKASITNVATRWVLDQPAVGAVIIGARLSESEHRSDNANLFSFALDQEDHEAIDEVMSGTRRLKGDCGSEYRQPPFLTAAGDLSDHLEEQSISDHRLTLFKDQDVQKLGTGSFWESVCGYSRAVKKGGRILVSGTTAIHGEDRVICSNDPRGQTVYILDKILSAVSVLGGKRSDIIRTRVYLSNSEHCEVVSRVHGRYFEGLNPANTTLEVSNLIGDHLVEIEAEAIVEDA